MKKLTFKITSEKVVNIASLIKEVNEIACRINFDIENCLVTVQDVEEKMIDTVIELVNNYYDILSVDIDNTIETLERKEDISEINEIPMEDKNEEIEDKKESTILEPQSEDDLIIKKVEFKNDYVEELVNKFLRTAYWAMYKMNIPEKDIGNYIYTLINEISMRYNRKEAIEFEVGDVITCTYGTHLPGETNGNKVSAIVCHVTSEKMVYLVPITKATENEIISRSYLNVNIPDDVTYYNDYYKGGIALLDKAKYVRIERINELIGRVKPVFLSKLLTQLAVTFDFRDNSINIQNQMSVSKSSSICSEVNENVEKKQEKIGSEETALTEIIGFALEKLNNTNPIEEQIKEFLVDINMLVEEDVIIQSFIIACNIDKINYESILFNLHDLYPHIEEKRIKVSLKENFKSWLKQYPELVKECPRISFISILKVFAKRFS